MSMSNYPFYEFYGYPKSVDTEGYYGQKKPDYVFSEQGCSVAVKYKLFAADRGMTGEPSHVHTDYPRSCDTKSNSAKKCAEK